MRMQDVTDVAKQVGSKAAEVAVQGAKWLGRQIQWLGKNIGTGVQKIWDFAVAFFKQAIQLGYKYLWSPAKDSAIRGFFFAKDFVVTNPQLCTGVAIGLGISATIYAVNKFACKRAEA